MFYSYTVLLDAVVEKKVIKELAETILKAMEIHEKSWDGRKYDISDSGAGDLAFAQSSLAPHYKPFIIESICYYWNEAHDWAREV